MNKKKIYFQKTATLQYLEPDEPIADFTSYAGNMFLPVLPSRIDSRSEDFIEDKPHKHSEMELIYVRSGSATIQIDGKMGIHLTQGKGICIKHGVVHSIEPDADSWLHIDTIHFHYSILFGSAAGMLAGKYLTGILNDQDHSFSTFSDETEAGRRVAYYMQEIYGFLNSSTYGTELRVIARLFEIWAIGTEALKTLPAANLTRQQIQDQSRIAKATTYISEHYTEDILLADIAGVCDVCNSECCRTFQRTLHMSPMDYVNRYRVYTAAEMLTNDTHNTPMSEIALSVGFNYASYFNKTFKKYLGTTPMQYRAAHNKAPRKGKVPDSFRI